MNISDPITDLLRISPMNKIILCFVFGFFVILNITVANDAKAIYSINDRFSDAEIAAQIAQLSDVIDVKFTKEIKTIINTYISSGRPGSEAILSRSNYYFPIMEHIIRKHNLPDEIKYLSVIESGLRPSVRSNAGAVGLWQFIGSTAKMYDLKIGSIHDERSDVARSTEAAMLYLNDLHNRFGDWALALAAYNCGPGNINKAIRRSGGGKTYWEVRKYLPKETRRYLPKMIATMYVMTYFDHYGMTNVSNSYTEYRSFAMANVFEKTSFKEISESSGLSISEISKYNPAYKHKYIPSSSKGNNLILPEMYLQTYLSNIAQLHLLQNVFHLRSSSLYDIKQEFFGFQQQSMQIENVRTDVQISELDLIKINLKTKPVAISLLGKVKSSQIDNLKSPRLVKLRKRQSFQDYMNEIKAIEKAKVLSSVEVNVVGVVELK